MRDTWMWTMKRYLLPLLIILMLFSVTMASCSLNHEPTTTLIEDKPGWSEKQVIDYLYKYLTDKAERAEDIFISMKFQNAVLEAMQESLKKDDLLGESVEMNFGESPAGIPITIWANALKYIAKYNGNGWWSVTIDNQEWRVNEVRNEVVTWNEEASKQFEKISTNTYHSSMYGYYIDYPSSWTINDNDKSIVILFQGTSNFIFSYVAVGVTDEKTFAAYKGLQGFIQARITSLRNQYYQFEVVKTTTTEIDYSYKSSKDSVMYEVRHYFVQNGGRLYEIVCSAKSPEFTFGKEYFGSDIYDAYYSFRFQP